MWIWKYPNKVKIVGKGGCVQHHSSNKRARWPTVFISLLNSALNFLQYNYVNIKKSIENKKLPKTSLNIHSCLTARNKYSLSPGKPICPSLVILWYSLYKAPLLLKITWYMILICKEFHQKNNITNAEMSAVTVK